MISLPQHLAGAPVGRETVPREARETHQRDRVLAAAAVVFARRGYIGTTVDHLVTAGEIGTGSFYQLFQGKEDCFVQAYDRIADAARERLRAAAQTAESPPAKVCAGLRELLELIVADPAGARLVLVEVQSAGPVALARHEETLDSAVPLLRRCRQLSPFASELPETLELATVGGVAWLVQQRLAVGELDRVAGLYPELADIVLGPYFGEEEAARLAAAWR